MEPISFQNLDGYLVVRFQAGGAEVRSIDVAPGFSLRAGLVCLFDCVVALRFRVLRNLPLGSSDCIMGNRLHGSLQRKIK